MCVLRGKSSTVEMGLSCCSLQLCKTSEEHTKWPTTFSIHRQTHSILLANTDDRLIAHRRLSRQGLPMIFSVPQLS